MIERRLVDVEIVPNDSDPDQATVVGGSGALADDDDATYVETAAAGSLGGSIRGRVDPMPVGPAQTGGGSVSSGPRLRFEVEVRWSTLGTPTTFPDLFAFPLYPGPYPGGALQDIFWTRLADLPVVAGGGPHDTVLPGDQGGFGVSNGLPGFTYKEQLGFDGSAASDVPYLQAVFRQGFWLQIRLPDNGPVLRVHRVILRAWPATPLRGRQRSAGSTGTPLRGRATTAYGLRGRQDPNR